MAEQQVEGKKWNIPRGTAAKNKYRDNKYDRAELAVPKGFRARMTAGERTGTCEPADKEAGACMGP